MPQKVIDLHCDSVGSLMAGKDLTKSVPRTHVDLPRMREGGVGIQVFAAYVPPDTAGDKAFGYANDRLSAIEAFVKKDERLVLVETHSDAKAAMASDKTGIMLSVENGLAIEGSLYRLKELRDRKVRIMTLVHSQHLPWIESCTGGGVFSAGEAAGLSSFGEKVVDAMNDLGIIADLSHSSEKAFWAVLKRSRKPVIASHSCAYSLCAAARNLKDDQIKALGESGGLVGVNFFAAFLSEPFRQSYEKNGYTVKLETASVHVPRTIIADHIDYMLKLAGEDSVALGSDFDGISATPEGVTGSDFFPVLEEELVSRGYTEKRIRKIFSGNFLRVLKAWE